MQFCYLLKSLQKKIKLNFVSLQGSQYFTIIHTITFYLSYESFDDFYLVNCKMTQKVMDSFINYLLVQGI